MIDGLALQMLTPDRPHVQSALGQDTEPQFANNDAGSSQPAMCERVGVSVTPRPHKPKSSSSNEVFWLFFSDVFICRKSVIEFFFWGGRSYEVIGSIHLNIKSSLTASRRMKRIFFILTSTEKQM